MDFYGEGPAVAELEQEVAGILGKETAVFVPKGVVAQQAALRVWADRSGSRNIALHPKSHIDVDEKSAYERLMDLKGTRLGKDHLPFTLQELEALHEPLGAVTVELPLRRAGFKLPSWEELEAISRWTKEHKVPLHFDGARIWETGPYYGRSYAEISALADSVYVSFYKGLGGLGGCILAGPKDFIDEVSVWKARLGGNLYTAFPYVITALEGLKQHLPKMGQYYTRALEIAKALSELPGVLIAPDPPQTNGFQVYLPAEAEALQTAELRLAEEDKIWLFGWFDETRVPGFSMGEIQIGDACEEWPTTEIVEAVRKLLEIAKSCR